MKKIAPALALALLAAPLFAATAPKTPPVKDLVEAAGQGNRTEISRLLKAGVPVDGRLGASDNGMTALTAAATIGQVDSVKVLLAAKADANLADLQGTSPLHKACFPPIGKDKALELQNKRAIVVALLSAKAKPNVKDKQGWTPLMLAASVGDAAIVKALLDAGADASAKLSNGKTALTLAEQGKNLEAAYLLGLKKKAR
ncbi:MAG: ankyrin repeat domain-containing protein [Elusimicrobia bacterium]|nr:ankyrin repeat domain-containing protein [Elusimicrobiota bacterium]